MVRKDGVTIPLEEFENCFKDKEQGLNEKFMRVYMMDREEGYKVLYFCISSEDYHWNQAIQCFLEDVNPDYNEFKVVIDPEVAKMNPRIMKNKKYFLCQER